ncbi:MAG TPA: Gfo/Idh/MocA family oxidoreductase [Acidimicrobiales bacterium]|nr:Gfo/Idh/MocA family oxidoreductase [Acidimicrobiales bacterium]
MIRMGIIGASGIAGRALVGPARSIEEVEIVGVAARDAARAAAFATQNGLDKVYPTYEALLEDASLDAVYVPLANSLHAKWSVAALEAGRHVLCEKPLASNAKQAREMVSAGDRENRVLMEAFHWRYHPVAARMIKLSKQIGPLERVEAHFNAHIPSDNIRFQFDLAGGSFMDLGCYCVHMVRTVVGEGPEVVGAYAVEGPHGIDLSMRAELSFPGGVTGVVSSSMVADRTVWPGSMVFRAWGEAGNLEVLNPMAPQFGHRITARLADGTMVDEVLESPASYEHQLRAFCQVVVDGGGALTGGADSVANMECIDAVYEASGLGVRH